MFSKTARRLPGETNELYHVRDRLKAAGHPLVDMIAGNVSELGIGFPQDLLEAILMEASRKSRVYRPDSLGYIAAREAVATYYDNARVPLQPSNILLTPGTSVAYWFCFKLLADEGDEILCPQPTYPLFDYIADLCGVRLVPYRLVETRGWAVDLDYLEASVSTRSRAIVLISPHNPTGKVMSREELQGLCAVAARHDLAVISDEVFCEFLLGTESFVRPCDAGAPLTIVLNGFSKMYALPGLKFGWAALAGEPDRVREAMRALELISDTFLPVNETVQAAAPMVFERGNDFLAAYRGEIRCRWSTAESLLAASGAVSFVRPDGGFYVSLRLRAREERSTAIELLEREGILVHPGYFYDMEPDHLVVAFVQPAHDLERTLPRFLSVLNLPAA